LPHALLRLARAVDWLNERVGWAIRWLILLAVLIGAGNAIFRYTFNISSNAWLEAQWYLYAAVYLFCSGYTLLRGDHVRIDVIAGQLSHRKQAWIDIFGGLFFLLPMSIMIMILSWPVFMKSIEIGEVSTNAGGLIVWPFKLLVPVGFLLLSLQGVSQIIKRIGFLAGLEPDPFVHAGPHVDLELLEELKKKEPQA
jgi:TRAP-type mannitol/chloroaromatic compound transport system permease small subunit